MDPNMNFTTVKPHDVVEDRQTIRSAPFDELIHMIIPFVLTYRLRREDVRGFLEQLKESLSRVLVPYYPFAGRWLKDEVSGRRMLVCNDEGVPFFDTYIDQDLDLVVDVNNLQHRIPSLSVYEASGVKFSTAGMVLPDVNVPFPSLVVQVMRFKCSGILLATTFYHGTCDAQGMTNFLGAWAEMSRTGDLSVIPCHDRALMPSTWQTMMDFSVLLKDADGVQLDTDLSPPCKVVPSSDKAMDPPEKHGHQKLLHVSKQVIDSIKKEATEDGKFVTTVDCISAHVWRSFSRTAKKLEGSDVNVCSTAVNAREKCFSPPLPKHYTGNSVFALTLPAVPDADLSKLSSVAAAYLVNTKVRQLNPASVPQLLVESGPLVKNVLITRQWNSFSINSWWAFDLYGVDFGYGRPTYAFLNSSTMFSLFTFGGCLVLPPSPAAESRVAAILHLSMPEHYMNVMLADPQFQTLFIS